MTNKLTPICTFKEYDYGDEIWFGGEDSGMVVINYDGELFYGGWGREEDPQNWSVFKKATNIVHCVNTHDALVQENVELKKKADLLDRLVSELSMDEDIVNNCGVIKFSGFSDETLNGIYDLKKRQLESNKNKCNTD